MEGIGKQEMKQKRPTEKKKENREKERPKEEIKRYRGQIEEFVKEQPSRGNVPIQYMKKKKEMKEKKNERGCMYTITVHGICRVTERIDRRSRESQAGVERGAREIGGIPRV